MSARYREFKNLIVGIVNRGVWNMGEALKREQRILLNTPGSRRHPAPPGKPPHKRTGKGQQGIKHEHQSGVSRVGFGRDALHLWFHERGINYGKRSGQTEMITTQARNDLGRFAEGTGVTHGGLQQRRSLRPALNRVKKKLGREFFKAKGAGQKGLSTLKIGTK